MSTETDASSLVSTAITALPQVTKPGRVPIKSWVLDIDGIALEQATNLSNLPFALNHVALMPDAHAGYGMPIGGVLFAERAVVPYAIASTSAAAWSWSRPTSPSRPSGPTAPSRSSPRSPGTSRSARPASRSGSGVRHAPLRFAEPGQDDL